MKKIPNRNPRYGESLWKSRFPRRALRVFLILVLYNVEWGMAQNVQKFTVNFKEKRLVEIFDYFEKNSDYTFTYNSAAIKTDPIKVTENFKDVTLSQILTKCLEKTRFTFEILDKHVVIKNRDVSVKEFRLKGKVLDEKGVPLPGVTILIEGTKIGLASDNKGIF